MITWNNFDWFALLSIALWGSGAVFALFSKERNRWAILLTLMGTLVFAVFIAGFWIYLQRPPLRTMGETRLWYSFFMGISGRQADGLLCKSHDDSAHAVVLP